MPQHGSIITKENVRKAFSYLKELKCGIDNFKKVKKNNSDNKYLNLKKEETVDEG